MMTRLRRAATGVLMSLGVLVLVVTFTPLVDYVAVRLSYQWTDSDGDILIVLAGDVVEVSPAYEDTFIGPSSYWRSIYAVEAWRNGHFQSVVISGGGIAEQMKKFLVVYGVPEQAIRIEHRSHSTRENALFTKELLQHEAGKKVLLTSEFHMYRAARAFRRAGLEIVPRPFGDLLKRSSSPVRRWECFWIEAGELAKILYYRFEGWI